MKNKKRNLLPLAAVIFGIIFLFAAVIYIVAQWVGITYDVDFTTLIYTLMSPLKGTGDSVVIAVLEACLPPVLLCMLTYGFIAFVLCQYRVSLSLSVRPERRIDLLKWLRRAGALFCIVSLLASGFYCTHVLGIDTYLKNKSQKTTIYEDYYVDPNSVGITMEGEPKNLIYIYLESGETTYASTAEGGAQEVNYIPEMTALAKENISFSDKDGLGGFKTTNKAAWTIAALFATSSGVPFSFPVEFNAMSSYDKFASGITVLGDILEQKGYRQEFLCGSDAEFGGRKNFFLQHGNYEIFDYYTAIEKNYIAEDYFEWWGFKDAILYEIAKDEALRLAAQEGPFNLTLLTADLHHIGGYICDKCGNDYEVPLGNVLACSDRLLADFVDWCKQQDFYENTVIVISGDHERMDTVLVDDIGEYDRTIYNCFINTGRTVALSEKNRFFTSMDMFPTVLYAMGFEIEGDRLGLGTNLFSSKQTLTEEIGLPYFESEINKSSFYYISNFS